MKKTVGIISVIMAVLTVIFGFSACGENNGETLPNGKKDGKPEILCTGFATYDWVRTVLGERSERFSARMLSGKGTDMHSYQPTADDIRSIGESAMFVYIGGESERWVEDIKKSVGDSKTVFVDCFGVINPVEEAQGIEGDHDHDHDDHDHDHDHDEAEYDEHIWLSLKNAEKLTLYIASRLTELDPEGKDTYEKNAKQYILLLAGLDSEYKKAVANAKRDTVIFADRFPFVYMMKDYGIKYRAAFSGCSAESEASFKTIASLSGFADEIKADTVLITETSDGAVANAVISGMANKGCKTAVMNSMQSVSLTDAVTMSYIGIMTQNLASLKLAIDTEG